MLPLLVGSAKQASAAAGQQESQVESLESIHAARLRSGSEAGTSAPQMGSTAAALTAKSQSASDSGSDDQAVFGNGGPGEADAESDPYLLPVSHEVALEGGLQQQYQLLHGVQYKASQICSTNTLHIPALQGMHHTLTKHLQLFARCMYEWLTEGR